jgi:hypothetical protein
MALWSDPARLAQAMAPTQRVVPSPVTTPVEVARSPPAAPAVPPVSVVPPPASPPAQSDVFADAVNELKVKMDQEKQEIARIRETTAAAPPSAVATAPSAVTMEPSPPAAAKPARRASGTLSNGLQMSEGDVERMYDPCAARFPMSPLAAPFSSGGSSVTVLCVLFVNAVYQKKSALNVKSVKFDQDLTSV